MYISRYTNNNIYVPTTTISKLLRQHFIFSVNCESDTQCPPNAVCQFSPTDPFGSGHCECPEGYDGDAYECIERTGPTCSCGPNAHCIETVTGELCVCKRGYHGDGYTCQPSSSCTSNSDCESHAECRQDASEDYVCQCIEGYIKDFNDACIPDAQLCNERICAEHASCLFDESITISYCHCDAGYQGDGITQCTLPGDTCDVANNCHPNAECSFVDNNYMCVCNEGYIGDGYQCTLEPNCRNIPNLCDLHASCVKQSGVYTCECNVGYNGNGSYCVLNPRQAGNFLVVTDGSSVNRVPLRGGPHDLSTPINSLPYQIAVGVDADCETGSIYWGDIAESAIKKTNYDGSQFATFLAAGKIFKENTILL